FVMISSVPLTPNGKTDRHALKALVSPSPAEVKEFVSPRDVLELKLAQIWQEVLGVEPIGVNDDFFELGGHSLMAVRLMARIKEELRYDVPLAALIRGGNIDRLAKTIREGATAESSLVALQTKGQRPPLFFVHPIGGNVLCYVDLARRLGNDQPFYGLQSAALNGDREPHTTIEAMAAEYVPALVAVQPNGPYRLGAWSFGCVVALEMACQLRKRGEEVELMALIDGWAPGQGVNSKDLAKGEDDFSLLLVFLADLGKLSGNDTRIDRDDFRGVASNDLLKSVFADSKARGVLPSYIDLKQFTRLFQVFRCNRLAALNYKPECRWLPKRTIIFRATEARGRLDNQSTLGWETLASEPIAVYDVPGDHYSMLRKPNSQRLASTLADFL
ncbi:MAG: thioesterase domain-containing protein, partial [Blastocatellia bacterium]